MSSSSLTRRSLSLESISDVDSLMSADVISLKNDDEQECLKGVDLCTTGADMSVTASSGIKHPRFFFGGGFVTFLVEDTLYRVHDYLFITHSSYWSEKLAEYKDDGFPIKIEGTTVHDMDAFLSVLYNTDFRGYNAQSTDDWLSVLRTSTAWKFQTIRELAIEKLALLASPLQKLVMSRVFNIPGWLQPALMALYARDEPLTLEEGKQLSTEDLVTICRAREALRLKTRVAVSDAEAAAYVTAHILCYEGAPLTSDPPSAPAQTVSNIDEESDIGSQAPLCITPGSTVSSEPLLLSERPSEQELSHLIAVLSQFDYDSAVAMTSAKGLNVFVDALRDFVLITWSDFALYRKLIDAVLRRSARDAEFHLVGVQLLFKMEQLYDPVFRNCHSICARSMLAERAMQARETCAGMRRVRSVGADFTLVVRYALAHYTPLPFFEILDAGGSKRLTEAMFDERNANLWRFFSSLAQADLLCKAYI